MEGVNKVVYLRWASIIETGTELEISSADSSSASYLSPLPVFCIGPFTAVPTYLPTNRPPVLLVTHASMWTNIYEHVVLTTVQAMALVPSIAFSDIYQPQ